VLDLPAENHSWVSVNPAEQQARAKFNSDVLKRQGNFLNDAREIVCDLYDISKLNRNRLQNVPKVFYLIDFIVVMDQILGLLFNGYYCHNVSNLIQATMCIISWWQCGPDLL
jgi:hypothetical protein